MIFIIWHPTSLGEPVVGPALGSPREMVALARHLAGRFAHRVAVSVTWPAGVKQSCHVPAEGAVTWYAAWTPVTDPEQL